MYNNIPLGLRKRLLAGSTFALLSLSAAPAVATDWWMIFGTGDTPNRDLFFADAQSVKATQQHPQNRQLTVVQVFESPNSPNYVSYALELQCPERQLRVNSATAYLRAGATTVLPAPKRWVPVPKSWLERGYDFACAPGKRKSNAMMPMGVGSIDNTQLVAITQQGLFNQLPGNQPIRIESRKSSTEDVMRDLNFLLGAPEKK